jgi:hypothetical protein
MRHDPTAYTTRRIVAGLFVRGATRLALMRGPTVATEVNLGGLCKGAVRDIVREELVRHEQRIARRALRGGRS